jgi:hypothetical protein
MATAPSPVGFEDYLTNALSYQPFRSSVLPRANSGIAGALRAQSTWNTSAPGGGSGVYVASHPLVRLMTHGAHALTAGNGRVARASGVPADMGTPALPGGPGSGEGPSLFGDGGGPVGSFDPGEGTGIPIEPGNLPGVDDPDPGNPNATGGRVPGGIEVPGGDPNEFGGSTYGTTPYAGFTGTPTAYPTEWNYDPDLGWVPRAEAVGNPNNSDYGDGSGGFSKDGGGNNNSDPGGGGFTKDGGGSSGGGFSKDGGGSTGGSAGFGGGVPAGRDGTKIVSLF